MNTPFMPFAVFMLGGLVGSALLRNLPAKPTARCRAKCAAQAVKVRSLFKVFFHFCYFLYGLFLLDSGSSGGIIVCAIYHFIMDYFITGLALPANSRRPLPTAYGTRVDLRIRTNHSVKCGTKSARHSLRICILFLDLSRS